MEGDDDRIEIELTSTEPRSPSASDEADGSHAKRSVRGKAVVALLVGVGLGAVLVGWVIGQGDEPEPTDEAGSTELADTPATRPGDDLVGSEAGEPDLTPIVETVPPADLAPRTTLAPPWFETTIVGVAAQLDGAEYELVGTSYGATPEDDGVIVALDTASGEMTVRHDALAGTASTSSAIWADHEWVVLSILGDPSRTVLLDGDAAPTPVDLGSPWEVVEAAEPGTFWRSGGPMRLSMPGDVVLVDRFGEPVDDPVTITQLTRIIDPVGGLVVVTFDGSYSVTHDRTIKVAEGSVLALDADRALVRRCDARACDHVIVDRATGRERGVQLDELAGRVNFVWGGGDTNTIAPDGRTVALAWLDRPAGAPRLGLVDLDDERVTTLTTSGDTTLRWSPDGRLAFYLDAGRLVGYDLAIGDSFIVSDDLPLLSGIAVRPSSG